MINIRVCISPIQYLSLAWMHLSQKYAGDESSTLKCEAHANTSFGWDTGLLTCTP